MIFDVIVLVLFAVVVAIVKPKEEYVRFASCIDGHAFVVIIVLFTAAAIKLCKMCASYGAHKYI